MKAKYIDKYSVSILDVDAELEKIKRDKKEQLYNSRVEDTVYNRLLEKIEDGIELTNEERQLVSTRKQIDEFFDHRKSQVLEHNKDFIEADLSSIGEFEEIKLTYKETETQVIQICSSNGKSRYKIKLKIAELQKQLSDSDYKIIKLYEAQVAGDEPPYDSKSVIDARQELRDKINELEKLLES